MTGTVGKAFANRKLFEQEIKKSKVRVWVTYLMSITYALTAVGLIGWLMYDDQTEMALGIFSGLASTSATIIAFWFGSRGSAQMRRGSDREDGGSRPDVQDDVPTPESRGTDQGGPKSTTTENPKDKMQDAASE